MENNTRNHKITFRMNDEEYEIFEHKLMLSKSKSKGEFIRKTIFNGIVLHFDEKKTKSAFRLLSNIANNFNQIAVRVNSTGNIYADDINEIKEGISELWQQLNYFLSLLRKLKT
ncbi:MAG: MobC family plasmid mobilization relaxosome protein [Ruminococcus flavefaciens]|nr:MobC family plasmid mobilization relaxosome protein [Clostridium sp.]MCM1234168.1 MobC family plasmid mobilization relaxosome protein [Ruminococcus flavefaciens]